MKKICTKHLLLTIVFLIFLCTKNYAQMPAHPSLLDKINRGEISAPYTLSNLDLIRSKGIDAPWAVPEIKQNIQPKIFSRSFGPAVIPTGNWKALAILVTFSDKPSQVDGSYFDNLLFGQTTGTLRDYYNKVSYNNLDIITANLPSDIGWTTAPQTYTYYVNGQNGTGSYPQNSQKLVEDVVNIVNPQIDFSQYDNDGDGYVDALFIIHSGPGAEFTGDDNDIWSHAWVTSTPQTLDGVNVYRYSIEPEFWQSQGDMTCGVFAHEMGHAAFGLPDLYDRDYSSQGLGYWSLMAAGGWNGPSKLGASPALPDAWSHLQMGYVTPSIVSANILGQSINNIESVPEAYLLQNSLCGTEYFLVENRQQTDYDTYLPQSGLCIYHIDEAVTTQNDKEWYPEHTSSGHYLVALEQADGLYNLDRSPFNYGNRGDIGDAFPGETDVRHFTNFTFPDSKTYSLIATGIEISNISSSSLTMIANFKIDTQIPVPQFIEQTSISIISIHGGLVAWGDYDNDGDLDVLLTGQNVGWNNVSKIYRNNGDNTFTEQTSISMIGLSGSAAAWGDYDNDGDLDILLTGHNESGGPEHDVTKIYRNNGDNTFSDLTLIPLFAVSNGFATWGDYDNDGDLDILLTGYGIDGVVSKIYRNDGYDTFTEQTSIPLIGVSGGSAAWGDYDNDGDLDILLTGQRPGGVLSKIYQNNEDNSFSEQTSITLIGVSGGSAAWGDYNNDGYLDILLTGDSNGGHVSKIYRNNGNNTFTVQTSISLIGVSSGSATWGDYDNDGNLDILLTGETASRFRISKIYHNNGDGTFTEPPFYLPGLSGGSLVTWADYDNDSKLDILITGDSGGLKTVLKIYRNNNAILNTLPAAPSNLQAVINGNDVTFSWDKSTDSQTPQNGLHYNLVLGATQNGVDKLSPMSDRSTGYRRVVRLGNSQTNNWTIQHLPIGNYYWSVQAIDNAFAGSNFAAAQNLTIGLLGTTPIITLQPLSQTMIQGQTVTFKVIAMCGGPLEFQWWDATGGQWNNGDKNGRLTIANTENSSTLTITNVNIMEDNNNLFLCEVKNLNGYPANGYWINTNIVTLSDQLSGTTPNISLQPIHKTAPQGQSISFTVEAECTGLLGFQWWNASGGQWNNGDKNGRLTVVNTANSSTLTITDVNIVEDNNNLFLCEVKNLDGYPADGYWINTNTVTLTVITGQITPIITLQPVSKAIMEGQTVSFTVEAFCDGPLGFQWWNGLGGQWNDGDKNGRLTVVNTENSSTLTIANANFTEDDNNKFLCEVKNLHGYPANGYWINTNTATLTIQFTEQSSISLPYGRGYWGDYDNDGDLDVLLIGSATKIYRNEGNNTFIEQISLTDVSNSSAAWGDYDNDGNLDILLTGVAGAFGRISAIYHNNGDNTFTEQSSISLRGVVNGSADWGDYDNDGNLDILLTGDAGAFGRISAIYHNNGDNTFTEQTSISLTGVDYSSAAWGDYDNDGDLDILLTGNSGSNSISKIYKNNGNNTFTEQTAISLLRLSQGSAAWGDYDNDGDLDILLSGFTELPMNDISEIYRNNGNNTFTAIATLGDHCGRSSAWGDYDNDGDLDIITNGDYSITRIFCNDGDNTFTNKITLFGKNFSSGEMGDYDNDGDLDILFNSKIYRNNNATLNTPPAAPSNLQAVINGNNVAFSWDKSSDAETPQNGLHYNLVIGTTPNGMDKLSPMADRLTGYRRVVKLGNSQTNNLTMKGLSSGSYYWSVQTIDNAFAGSNFAGEQNFTIGLKVIPEGLYNTVTNTMRMKDSIKAYLRNISSPYSIVDSAAAILDSINLTFTPHFLHAPSGNYYLVITHRNSIETWSNAAITFTDGSSINYDFTNDSSKAYGNNMIKKGNKWCIYSGDVNQDGFVNSADLDLIKNEAFNYSSGYVSTDLTGDGFVDMEDLVICDNNAFKSVEVKNPLAEIFGKPSNVSDEPGKTNK